jgi:hypothetical protein
MLRVRHPPSSWTVRKSTPAATRREAKVCRRACHVTPSSRAASFSPVRRPERGLCGCHGPYELTGDRPVGGLGDKLLGVPGACPLLCEAHEGAPSCAVERYPPGLAVLCETHGDDARQQVHVVPAEPGLLGPPEARIDGQGDERAALDGQSSQHGLLPCRAQERQAATRLLELLDVLDGILRHQPEPTRPLEHPGQPVAETVDTGGGHCLPRRPAYLELDPVERAARRAWLEGMVGRALASDEECENWEACLYKAARWLANLRSSHPPYRRRLATGGHVRVKLVKRHDRQSRQCITFSATRSPRRTVSHVRPNPDLEHFAELLLAANGLVAKCKNRSCELWFSRTTAKQEYCTPRCSDRGRKCASRRRKGV